MSSTTYPFDPTGLAISNLITNEPHLLTEIATSASEVSYDEFHLLIPDYSPFFNDGFILTHVTGGVIVPLVRGTDYELCLPYLDASRSTLKDIFGGISILRQFSSGLLKITYQTIGGDWIADKERALLAVFNQPWFNIRTTSWDVLTDKSNKFPIINHDNATDFIDDHSSLVDTINLASIGITSTARQSLSNLQHEIDLNNPHHVIKDQIGLPDLVNYPPATLAEARTFKKVDKYATMAAVMEFLNAFNKQVAISGPSTITVGTPATFTIINYRSYMTYKLEVTGGTATIVGNTITLTPSSPSTMISFSINGTTVPVYSRPVNSPATGSVTISGNRTVGMTLTATNTIADTDGLGPFHYQWYSGTTPVGSDSDKYVSVTSDITSFITCVVSYKDKLEYLESVTSNRFGPIRKVDSLPTGSVVITGITTVFETITADTSSLADANALGSLHYEWFADGTAIGTDSPTYTLQHDDRKKRVTCKVSYLDGDEYTDSIISAPTALIRDYNHLPIGDVTIATVATVSTTLVATNTITDENGLGALHYQWYSGLDKVGTDNATYTPVVGDIGKIISCTVSYTDEDNYTDSVISNGTNPVKDINHPPTGTATVDGTASVGSTLTVNSSIADQNSLGTFSYQWKSGTTPVGTNSNSYTVTSSDVGNAITCVITYTDGDGYSNTYNVTTGSGTTPVAAPNSLPVGSLIITGTMSTGSTITADASGVTDADGLGTFTYTWYYYVLDPNGAYNYNGTHYRAGYSYPLQTGSSRTYTLKSEDAGNYIGAMVEYTDKKGNAEYVMSDFVSDFSNGNVTSGSSGGGDTGGGTGGSGSTTPNATGSVVIGVATGSNTVGNTMYVLFNTIADMDGLGTFSYQWKSGTTNVGTDSDTYVLQSSDVNKSITCVVSYTDGSGTVESKTSNSIGPITAAGGGTNTLPTGSVTISGTTTVGSTLTVSSNTLADADGLGTFHYQWKSGAANVGADSISYVLQSSDLNMSITCIVSYIDGKGTSESKTSNSLGPITSSGGGTNSAPTGNLTIDGSHDVGSVLTINTSKIADTDGLGPFTYIWYVDGSTASAVGSTYTIQAVDLGKDIYAKITYVDGKGKTENVISNTITVNTPHTGNLVLSRARGSNTVSSSGSGISDVDVLTLSTGWVDWWLGSDFDPMMMIGSRATGGLTASITVESGWRNSYIFATWAVGDSKGGIEGGESNRIYTGITGWIIPPNGRGGAYGVWKGANAANTTVSFSANVYIPADGAYSVKYLADDKITWAFNGDTPISHTFTNTERNAGGFTEPVTLTKGNNVLDVSIYNAAGTAAADFSTNPGYGSIVITDGNGTIVWTTLDVVI